MDGNKAKGSSKQEQHLRRNELVGVYFSVQLQESQCGYLTWRPERHGWAGELEPHQGQIETKLTKH
jgi:hypothetical protein